MTLFDSFFTAPLAQALGWTLLHSLWQGAILAAVLAAILLPLRSPRARYAAACASMAMMLGAVGFTLIRLLPAAPHTASLRLRVVPWFVARAAADTAGRWDPLSSAALAWLAAFWIVGVLAFYLRNVAGLVAVHRLRRRGVCSAPERWQRELDRLREKLRLSRPVLLLESSLAETPVVLGHFGRLILMPVGLLAGLPVGQVEAILLHELAHVRRHDYLVNVLQRLLEGLLFYHPAVWWISRVIRVEREHCCDDVVVSIRGEAQEYAAALAALEEIRAPGREPAVALTGGSLVKRIRRLLYPKGSNGVWTPVFAAVILVATLVVTLAAWQGTTLQAAPAPQEQADNASTPYMKWLNQDVVYIIDNAERAAFLKLATDDERKKFIEQFWDRRNPIPGSAVNDFKEEHYRRIAYVNRRFGLSGTAGWRTDRGHMYINYGPPDEIEARTDAMAAQEVWLYQWVQGVGDRVKFTFIDRMRSGDYRLAPGNGR